MIKAILLDIDGTMRDSRAMIYHSYQQTFAHFAIDMPGKEGIARYMYTGPEKLFEHFAPDHSTQELTDYYRSILGSVLDKIGVYPGVVETLQILKDKGLTLGVFSASKYAKSDLASGGLDVFMDVIIDGHTPTRPKPFPDGAELALKQLGVDPADAIMVGDLPADIEAGRAVHLRATVALTHGFGPRQLLQASGPDYIIDGFPELLSVVEKLA
jgi:pyrophosphatase PpaX